MKTISLLLALTLFAFPALACKCAMPPLLKDLSQLDKYTFIALVTITDDGDQQGTSTLQFTVKELFKGVSRNNIQEGAKNTSCDLYIKKGQEWLVFGVLTDGKLYIQPCDRNRQYRNEKGEKGGYEEEIYQPLEILRELYRKPPPFHKDGPVVTYYENGQKEIEEHYLNGRLHGERKIWFANGLLKKKEGYLNGLKEGKWERYFSSGAIMDDRFYKAGKDRNIWRFYFADSLAPGVKRGPVALETVYDIDGRVMISRRYYRSGQIRSESIFEHKKGYGISIDYHPNGVVQFIQHWPVKGKPSDKFQKYDEQGIAIKSENWMKEDFYQDPLPPAFKK